MVLVVFMKKSLFCFGNVRPLALLRKAVENVIYFIVWELSCLSFPGSFFFFQDVREAGLPVICANGPYDSGL